MIMDGKNVKSKILDELRDEVSHLSISSNIYSLVTSLFNLICS